MSFEQPKNALTVAEAAELLGVTPGRVRHYLADPERYKLKAALWGCQWMIDSRSVHRLIAEKKNG